MRRAYHASSAVEAGDLLTAFAGPAVAAGDAWTRAPHPGRSSPNGRSGREQPQDCSFGMAGRRQVAECVFLPSPPSEAAIVLPSWYRLMTRGSM
jgi:hypothetical protein